MTIPYFEGFDYGGEVAEKEVHFKLWPTTGGMTGAVDADLLPYRVGFMLDELSYHTAKLLVKEGHYSKLEDTPQFEDAFEQLCCSLNYWLRKAKCDSAKLYSTLSANNFRLNIAYSDPYKGQRTKDKPPFFEELKRAMTERLGCVLADGVEADDLISMDAYSCQQELGVEAGSAQHKEFCNVTVISSDKDSTISAGRHYNPDTDKTSWNTELGELLPKYKNAMVNDYIYVGTGQFWSRGEKAGQEKMKRVLIGKKPSEALTDLKGSGLKFFYAQIIMGDAADNYKGLPSYGMTAAFNSLNNCKTEKELYLKTLSLYKEHYGTGNHWCSHYKGTEEYYKLYKDVNGVPPPDFDIWKGRGAYLTAYDRMLEQGRLAWMLRYKGDIWRKDKGQIIDPHDLEFWHVRND